MPEQDRPTLADILSSGVIIPSVENSFHSEGCFAGDLYYSNAPDRFRKARFCAFAKLGLFRSGTDPKQVKIAQSVAAFGATDPELLDVMDSAVLGMLYANGEGVHRNLPLARQFVCGSSDGVGGDSPEDDLNAFEQTIKDGAHYDACAVASGRSMAYRCTGLQERHTAEDIGREENAIAVSLPPALRPWFRQLLAAKRAFDEASSKMFEDGSGGGTGCGLMGEEDDLKHMNEWLALLKNIHQNGTAPAAGVSASSLQQLNRRLNQIYLPLVSEQGECDDPLNCASIRADTRTADQAWLRYRDAWVSFGTLRWPTVTADQWRAWQTAEWFKLLTSP